MRVGINILYLVPGEVGGSEIYARELIPALAAERTDDHFMVYCAREAAESLRAERWPENIELRELSLSARNKPARVAFEIFRLPSIARRDHIDVMHSLGQTTPLWGCGARVVSVLDLIYHHYATTFPGPARRGLELLVPLGAKRADRVTTISLATKLDLVATYGIDAEKIDPVLLGAGFTEPQSALTRSELDARFGLPAGEFALCVASAHAHKNIPRLLEAFAGLPGRNLVLVGHAGLDQDELIAITERLKIADRVTFTGWIESEELEGLYRAATMFVYPTLLEGFGLPVLEAMLRGVPVACSNTSSLPEVAGNAAAMFDPLDVGAIGRSVELLFRDPLRREELVELGRRQAAKFTWQACAQGTLACYEKALRP
jgi:glycosyltransferase involved in cell wall biosynthesis